MIGKGGRDKEKQAWLLSGQTNEVWCSGQTEVDGQEVPLQQDESRGWSPHEVYQEWDDNVGWGSDEGH